jgi:HEAT repeat protein
VPPDERRAAIYELKADPTEANVLQIRAWLADPDRDVRATALNGLVGLQVDDAPAIARAALNDRDGFVRATAAKLLGDLGDPLAVEALAPLLEADPDPVARQRAAESIARLGGDPAVRVLALALADPMERVRRAAIAGLVDLDPGFARHDLARLLREDAVWEVRAEAAHALGRTGDPAVVADLEAALDDPNEFVRTAAANALRLRAEVRPAKAPDD